MVQVYEEKLNTFQSYNRGSPVSPSDLTSPYQSLQPLDITFSQFGVDGRWLVQLTQDSTLKTKELEGWSGSYGTLSEAVVVVTDLAGIVHSYYQDLRAEVTSLPKYGELSSTGPHTPSAYGGWREAYEVGPTGVLSTKYGMQRKLGMCYGDTDCAANFYVPPLLSEQSRGSTPDTKFLRNERVVIYLPKKGYLGPDYFTYIIHDGLQVQTHESGLEGGVIGMHSSVNEVTVHVRSCRRFNAMLSATPSVQSPVNGICVCAQTELSLINDTALCDSARRTMCEDSKQREKFLSMCLPCFDPARGLSSGDCQAQTVRAVSLFTSRGMCSSKPPMDCSTETVTEPGREKTNYLSLKPPYSLSSYPGAFSRLKNSFGAYGWYHSPALT